MYDTTRMRTPAQSLFVAAVLLIISLFPSGHASKTTDKKTISLMYRDCSRLADPQTNRETSVHALSA